MSNSISSNSPAAPTPDVPTPAVPTLTAPTLEVKPLPGRHFLIKWTQGGEEGIEVFVDFGDDYPEQGQILVGGEATIAVEGVTGTSLVSAKVKAIYRRDGQRIGALGPTYSTLLLP